MAVALSAATRYDTRQKPKVHIRDVTGFRTDGSIPTVSNSVDIQVRQTLPNRNGREVASLDWH